MTTAEHARSNVAPKSVVHIAGVPWPLYKVVALVAGLAVLLVVGVATASPAPAVLAAAGAATVVWLGLGLFYQARS